MMKTDLLPTEPEEAIDVAEPAAPRARGRLVRVIVSAVLVVVLLSAGAALFRLLWHTRPIAERRDAPPLPPLVAVQTLAPQDIREVFVGYGSARADRQALIAAEVSGRVIAIGEGVKDGARVAAEQVLVRIDDRQYQRELERARSRLADVDARLARLDVEKANVERLIEIAAKEARLTEEEYERVEALFKENHATRKERDFARLAYQTRLREWQGLENEKRLLPARAAELRATRGAREAEVKLAQLSVERCTIRAPFAGQIEAILVEAGDHVSAGGQIARLVDDRLIEVPVELPLSVRPRVGPGARCVLSMDSMPGAEWEATVRRLSPMADTASRTFTAYLEVDNARQQTPLVPGVFLTARVEGPMIAGALVIPRGAILGDHVLVMNDEKAHARPVRVEALVGDRAVVSGAVAAGDRVILTNLDALYEGAAVRWREAEGAAGP